MDTLNDYYPLYPDNPAHEGLSESELEENHNYIEKIKDRKKPIHFDDFCMLHSDDLWYLWCIINEFTQTNVSTLLNKMDYPSFCDMCYKNSSR